MKLTNKQLSLVVDMIFDNVKNLTDAKQKKIDAQFKAEGEAMAKKSILYLKIDKAFKLLGTTVKLIEIKDNSLNDTFGDLYSRNNGHYCDYESFTSPKHFLTQVASKYASANNKCKPLDKRDIEKKVLMSMLNASDLQELIDSITKTFII